MGLLCYKMKKLPVLLTLIALIWVYWNLSYFAHIHIDANGKVIVHAHPYNEQTQKRHSVPKHTHSKSEFSILALIVHTLSLFLLFLCLFLFNLHYNSKPKAGTAFQRHSTNIFYKTIFKRGPPAVILF